MDGFWVVKEVVLMNFFKQVPQYMLCLQNGRFDHPDRMFNSISDTWRNVTTDAADFKELIPEFYDPTCNGDFLVNSLNLDFGKHQNGCAVGDVELPQWAQGPAHFIRTCREALESSFVSENLHDWIDLIFGYKQTGEEAVLADNVYYHLTYEGSVDLDSIQDIYERHSLEVQIMEFGQTPKQIFKHPHPQRCCTVLPRSLSMASDSCPDSLLENVSSIPEELETRDRAPSISSFAWKRNMADLTKMAEHMLHNEMVTHVCFSSSKSSVFSVSQDSLLKLYSLEQKQQLRSVNISHMALSSCIVMNDKTVVVGSWDNYVCLCWDGATVLTGCDSGSILVWDLLSAKLVATVSAHSGPVTCIHVKEDGSDGKVVVWQSAEP
ncbi:protein FAN-like [Amblyomma americanum]